jgi:hypothetical protein
MGQDRQLQIRLVRLYSGTGHFSRRNFCCLCLDSVCAGASSSSFSIRLTSSFVDFFPCHASTSICCADIASGSCSAIASRTVCDDGRLSPVFPRDFAIYLASLNFYCFAESSRGWHSNADEHSKVRGVQLDSCCSKVR